MKDVEPFEPNVYEFMYKDRNDYTDRQKRILNLIFEIVTGYRRTKIEIAFPLLEIAVEIYNGDITPMWFCEQLTRCYRGDLDE